MAQKQTAAAPSTSSRDSEILERLSELTGIVHRLAERLDVLEQREQALALEQVPAHLRRQVTNGEPFITETARPAQR